MKYLRARGQKRAVTYPTAKDAGGRSTLKLCKSLMSKNVRTLRKWRSGGIDMRLCPCVASHECLGRAVAVGTWVVVVIVQYTASQLTKV